MGREGVQWGGREGGCVIGRACDGEGVRWGGCVCDGEGV